MVHRHTCRQSTHTHQINFVFLKKNAIKHIFKYLLTSWVAFIVKCLIQGLYLLLVGFLCLGWLVEVLDYGYLLSDIWIIARLFPKHHRKVRHVCMCVYMAYIRHHVI